MSLITRFWQYQKERFPVFVHIPLIAAFSFSAIAFSRTCRGLDTFVSWKLYFGAAFMAFTTFLMLRIADEFKDQEFDARTRPHLPVPRGLVTLQELKWLGIIVVIAQIIVQIVLFPKMLWLYLFVNIYLALMTKEFFVKDWLERHQFWYVTSHMFIIPFVDIYASGVDWFLDGSYAPVGLIFFFVVSYFNGLVLEIGRKIKATDNEESNSYTRTMGIEKSSRFWILLLFLTFIAACAAAYYAGYGYQAYLYLGLWFVICTIPAVLFMKKPTVKNSKMVELASVLWTFSLYLGLGAIPFLLN